jgi:hypothetical protein
MKELKSTINIVEAAAPAVGKATIAGNAIDMKGYHSLTVFSVIGAGAYAAAKTVTPTLQESDDGTTYSPVATGDYDGDLSIVDSVQAANQERVIAYTGDKRYVKFGFTVGGTLDANVFLGAWAIKGHPELVPTT